MEDRERESSRLFLIGSARRARNIALPDNRSKREPISHYRAGDSASRIRAAREATAARRSGDR